MTPQAAAPRFKYGVPLWIAEGTPYALRVVDIRDVQAWSVPSAIPIRSEQRGIVYHHTAGSQILVPGRWAQITRLQIEASQDRYGLPYNFVVMPTYPFTVYYLNDVDKAWPHTYDNNDWIAVCAVGNYEDVEPYPELPARMLALADALATMYGRWMPEVQHRDVYATLCPGDYLSPLLRR